MEYENTVSGNALESSDTINSDTSVENESVENDSTETDINASETVSESSGENQNKDITERLDELISILTPADEENEKNESSENNVSENSLESSSEGSSSGSMEYEMLEGINDTLTLIKSENAAYYKDTLYIQENIHKELQHISFLMESALVVSIVIGFFVAMHVGGKMISYFFGRMR